jgi:hypothetical protein
MERIVEIALRSFVVIFRVIISRLDHHVTDLSVIKVEEFPE